jgi:predicted nucleic acid-binding protein
MRFLLDINVILDILLDRKPHVAASALVWTAIESGKVNGSLPAHAVTTIHYLVRRERGAATARRTVDAILRVLDVAKVDAEVIRRALELGWGDFEDAVTAAAAEAAHCQAVVTRDPKGFPGSPVRVVTPEAAASLVERV